MEDLKEEIGGDESDTEEEKVKKAFKFSLSRKYKFEELYM